MLNTGVRWNQVVKTRPRPLYHPESEAVCTVQQVLWEPLPDWTVLEQKKFLAPWGLESRAILFVVSRCPRSYTYQKINKYSYFSCGPSISYSLFVFVIVSWTFQRESNTIYSHTSMRQIPPEYKCRSCLRSFNFHDVAVTAYRKLNFTEMKVQLIK